MAGMWWVMFVLAVVAIGGGVWRGIEQHRNPTAFDMVGLSPSWLGECITVTPFTRAAKKTWPSYIDEDEGGCLTAVDGRSVSPAMGANQVGQLLAGAAGAAVTLNLAKTDGTRPVARSFVRTGVGWYEACRLIAFTLVEILYAAVALLLQRRRPHDRIFMRMSFIFLLVLQAAEGPVLFWGWVLDPSVGLSLAFIGITLLMTTLPAFPTGAYVPRAARWLRLLVPATVIGLLIWISAQPGADTDWADRIMLPMVGLGVGLLVLRFYRMPDGLERQQVKWAVFGLAVGLLMLLATDIFPEPSGLTAIFELITILGLALIPAGVGISLLEYRLNDADAAAGKSLGYAIVTVIVGAAWTVIQSFVGDAFKQVANPTVIPAVTTVLAALVFNPARTYALSWTERKFQPALVRLRKLPENLARWQSCTAPEELAELALADLVRGVGAAHAAILGDDGRQWRLLAAFGIDPDTASAQLSPKTAACEKEAMFPIRIELADQIGQPDLLAIGPRSDGASFTGDEKKAIAMIVGPLSNALQTAALRERHSLKVETSLAGIDTRLSRIEDGLGGGRAKTD
jgi:hypothetical protein